MSTLPTDGAGSGAAASPAVPDDEVVRLRHAYLALVGAPPAPDWDAARLRARLAADAPAEAPPPPDPETVPIVEPGAPWRRQVSLVEIVVTADHVYLPLDAAGRGLIGWRDAGTTVRVPRRARLLVPDELARFLSGRDQAEIVG